MRAGSLLAALLMCWGCDADEAITPPRDAAPEAAWSDAAPPTPTVGAVLHPAEATAAPRAFELRFRDQGAEGLAEGPAMSAPVGGCRGDRLFIDLPAPARVDPIIGPVDLTQPLRARLQAEVDALRFTQPRRAPWLWIDEPDLCAALARIRAAAAEVAEVDEEAVAVGRLCALSPLSEVGDLTPEVERWHLDVLDPDGIAPAAPGEGAVHLALIDEGAGLEPVLNNPFADSRRLEGLHGLQSAALIRQAAPGSSLEIHDLPIFDLEGLATTHDLARAIDAALALPAPTIINLSVGWAPELSQPRVLQCGDEVFTEAPIGAAVRRALGRARDRDALGAPVAAFAAVGQRAARPEDTAAAFGAPEVMGDPCLDPLEIPWGDAWTLPAEWRFTPSCEGGGRRALLEAVGVYEHRGLPAMSAMMGRLPPLLLAPGLNVIVDGEVRVGASISTALTSAVAARAQLRRLEQGLDALDAPTLSAALYTTGWDTWQPARSMTAPNARGISLCRLERALGCLELDEAICPMGDLIRCLRRHNQGAPQLFDGRLHRQCERCLNPCLSPPEGEPLCRAGGAEAPRLSEAYFAALGSPDSEPHPGVTLDLSGQEMAACFEPPCPFDVYDGQPLLDPMTVGRAPRAWLSMGGAFAYRPHLMLALEVSPEGAAPPEAAWLLVGTPGRGVAYIGLDTTGWTPGELIFIHGLNLPAGVVDLRNSHFLLRLIDAPPGARPALTQAELMLNFNQ